MTSYYLVNIKSKNIVCRFTYCELMSYENYTDINLISKTFRNKNNKFKKHDLILYTEDVPMSGEDYIYNYTFCYGNILDEFDKFIITLFNDKKFIWDNKLTDNVVNNENDNDIVVLK